MWKLKGPALAFLLINLLIGSESIVRSARGQLSPAPEYYYARYRINGARPPGFGEIAYLVLGLRHSPSGTQRKEESVKYDEQGNALINGEVWTQDNMSYQFDRAKLVRSTTLLRDGCGLFTGLSVTTKAIGGVNYTFEGQFLKRPERLGQGDYSDLRGVLTRFVGGQRIAQTNIDLTKLGVE
jgi:hypothetical protein